MLKIPIDNLPKTEIVGLLGYPVEHSFSPLMHNAAFKELDLNYLYLLFEVLPKNLKAAIDGIRGLNLKGVNLTIPHKEKVIPYLDEISKEAELIGAVNTIKNDDGKLIGYNTDGKGFVKSLLENDFYPQDKNVLVIGAGGAARAVSFQLGLEGVNGLYITNRTFEKAEVLVKEIDTKLHLKRIESVPLEEQKLYNIISKIDLIVDTTPIGMHPNHKVPPVINPEMLHQELTVVDLVYNPVETTLLKAARKAGAKVISGLGMLIHQGAIAFEIWTGKTAPTEIMKKEFEKYS
ncbi:shikimate dehydrogenase [Selenihalanaerobacter shriftii]|uniref:Shikimate dehydrogenase (NADP(+)) n=1 Tax=Selenihalanaerobacter shriftii TaxID=142842 RepID=A0A1T4P4F2_9FIRM|nr:shikimate dehydrogenase [Selenihalanaerobacter shriftii]SJZ86393.1 shikimate dehydrogenase [Selenihalanaerobacter shriftii]